MDDWLYAYIDCIDYWLIGQLVARLVGAWIGLGCGDTSAMLHPHKIRLFTVFLCPGFLLLHPN